MLFFLMASVSYYATVLAQEEVNKEKVTLSGYIKDGQNGETLIGASVFIPDLAIGSVTNVYGFYSLSVPKGSYQLTFSYVGFESQKLEVNLSENKSLTVELKEASEVLNEVVISGEKEDVNITSSEMSVNKLSMKTIEKLPALLGEVDVVRSIQLLPGVSTVGEGASGFNVRGGSIDQNLVLLDEAPVYNSSHLFGFFSVFNPDAVKDVKLYKGGIPARYGGRLSSILDVRMKEGNSKNYAVSGGLGLIFSRLTFEGPIVKDKASFIIAGRRSYADILAQPFLNDDLSGAILNFYDLTLKTNYSINQNNRIFLSGYLGRDNFGFGEGAGFNWGNATTTLRWNHIFNDRLFSNFTGYYSNYDYEIGFGAGAGNSFDWNASIVNHSLKTDFTYFLNPKNIITFGGQSILYTFQPGNAVAVSEGDETDFSLPKKYALESGIFVENEQTINDKLSLHYGVRFSHFNYMGEGTAYEFKDTKPGQRKELVGSEEYDQWESIQTYNNLEPRFSIKYQIHPTASVKASYNRTAQYIHLISNTTASTPVDVWTPSTNNLKPQMADQVGLGLFKNFKDNAYSLSVEGYYKDFDNLLEYVDGATLFLNELLDGEVLEADGRAYGTEIQLEKKKGRVTGWLSYTLARTERQVDGINNDNWFPARFDQTHNVTTTLFYDLTDRWTLSGNFTFTTGTPATFPTSRIELDDYIIPHNATGERNNVRIPNYHRLDLAATLAGKKKDGKRWSGDWVFSVYNVYNRRNPFSIFFRQQQIRPASGEPVNTDAVKFSVIGSVVPSVSYNFKFQ